MVKAVNLGDSCLKIIFNNPRNKFLHLLVTRKFQCLLAFQTKKKILLFTQPQESGIFITLIRKKVPRVLVMFPVQVRDTRNKDDFKNVDCSPKVNGGCLIAYVI